MEIILKFDQEDVNERSSFYKAITSRYAAGFEDVGKAVIKNINFKDAYIINAETSPTYGEEYVLKPNHIKIEDEIVEERF